MEKQGREKSWGINAPSCDHFGRHGQYKKNLVTKTATVIWRTVFGSNVPKHNHLLVSVYNIIMVFKISSEKNICEFLHQLFFF